MHELTLMQGLVEAIEAHVGTARVHTVRLDVGRLTCVVPEALRFCFDVCTHGTPLAGSVLEIVPIPGRARCRACGVEADVDGPFLVCACGSGDLDVLCGDELRVRELEVS
jgi:hydrogenase nickel incorporation protein HypA/HybF